ncbi:MAG: hypothetical protein N3A69_10350, partial [Leptospiraceae bacterium]|nr:hypothetical protein [Leptospiraceae bacterium]
MSKWALYLTCILTSFTGCNTQISTGCVLTKFPEPPKKILALASIINHTECNLPWNIADELSENIRNHIQQKNRIGLCKEMFFPVFSQNLDPFKGDISWMKQSFTTTDFAAFIELLNHQEVFLSKSEDMSLEKTSAELILSARLLVFDLRDNQPRIILKEVIEQSHYIPKQFT